MNYGISNLTGKIPESEIRDLLECCWRWGLTTLDTASAYGDSEAVLGRNLPADRSFAIITKTIALPVGEITVSTVEAVESGLHASLERLRQKNLYAVLVHHGEDLLHPGGERLYQLLSDWKRAGRVEKIGASVYDGDHARQLMERFALDLMQLPINVFDQRLIRDGTLQALKSAGVELHARSVLLQGLLLMRPEQLPVPMRRFAPWMANYWRYLAQHRCSAITAALGFIKHLPELDLALIGVNSLAQLQECIVAYDEAPPLRLEEFASDEIDLVDPRRWKLQ